MEKWDLFDENRNKLSKTASRGDVLEDGEFHLVVNGWIKNNKGEFLISQRAKNKTFPLMWEATGGSAISGETSIEAVTREIKEELGININTKKAVLIGTEVRYFSGCNDFVDVWVIENNSKIEELSLAMDEVCDAMWASKDEILELLKQEKFVKTSLFEQVVLSDK